jgi:hypothetical protein
MTPLSAVRTIGPSFFLAIAMFNFVLQMSSLVTEKELKLRQVNSDVLSMLRMQKFHVCAYNL